MTGPAHDALLEHWRTRHDTRAMGELLKSYRDRAYATAFRILGHGYDAEDAVQNAFVKLLSRTHGLENEQEFQRTVFRAVVQCALDQLRNRRRGLQRMDALSRKTGDSPLAPEADPVEGEETRILLREALQRLPEEDRVAVVLCYEQSLTLGDVASILDMPRQTLRNRLDRALESLRNDLRRTGVLLSPIMLTTLLGQEGTLVAPPSFCARLSELFPSGPGMPAVKILSTLKASLAGTAVVALVLVLALHVHDRNTQTVSAPSSLGTGQHLELEPGHFMKEERNPGFETQNRRTDMERKSLAGITLATALLVAPAVHAGEKDDVEAVLKEIRALKAEKTAAEEKARKAEEVQRVNYMEQHTERKGVEVIHLGGPGGIVAPGQAVNAWGVSETKKNPQ